MPDRFDLDRFTKAQAPVFAQVQQELRAGQKRSHWMWYVFPQFSGLGHSPTARHYAIASSAEAQAFLAHPILGPRLVECTALVNAVEGRTVHQIFGSPDDLKFHSSITLFAVTDPDDIVFQTALNRYFGGQPDRATLDLLGRT